MKKISLLVLAFVLVFSLTAAAENLEFVGGVTYNTGIRNLFLGFDESSSYADYEVTEGYYNGFGFYGGARYWLNENLGFGAGLDMHSVTASFSENYDLITETIGYESRYTDKLIGPYGELVYKLNDFIKLNGGLAYYSYTNHQYYDDTEYPEENTDQDELKGKGLGYIFGAEMEIPLNEDIKLKSSIGYRLAKINITEVYDESQEKFVDIDNYDVDEYSIKINGFRFSAGVSYKF